MSGIIKKGVKQEDHIALFLRDISAIEDQNITFEAGADISSLSLENIIQLANLNLNQINDLKKTLSMPNETADLIRLSFLKQVHHIENELLSIHSKGKYADPFQGTKSHFGLMEEILNGFKISILNSHESVYLINLYSSNKSWPDSIILALCKDLNGSLSTARFNCLWDAFEYYQASKFLLTQAFILLEKNGTFNM